MTMPSKRIQTTFLDISRKELMIILSDAASTCSIACANCCSEARAPFQRIVLSGQPKAAFSVMMSVLSCP